MSVLSVFGKMVKLPDECDFCDRVLEEDEELSPIWIGDQPEPRTEIVSSSADKTGQKMGANTLNGNKMVLGQDIGQLKALLDAVENSDSLTVDYKEAVIEEVHKLGEEEPREIPVQEKSLTDAPPSYDEVFGDQVNYNKVAVELRIKPELQEQEPDLEVCSHCEESLKSM